MVARLRGSTLPREWGPAPLPGRRHGEARGSGCPCRCGLSRSSSLGFRVIAWARRNGWLLHPWQRWLLIHALELDADGARFRFRTIVVLVARQNGKTHVKMVLTLWRMYQQNVRLCVGTAQDLSQAREVMAEGLVPMMLENEQLRQRFDPDADDPAERRGVWHKTLNYEYIRLEPAKGARFGPRYVIKALNRKAGRGLWNVAEVNIDELREQTDFAGWSAISKVVMSSDDGQIWCMSNAGDRQSVLLNQLRGVGLAGVDEQTFLAEWSAPKGCPLDDPNMWVLSNPSLGYPGGTTVEAIRSSLHIDPAPVFRTEVLCQDVDSMHSAVDVAAWSACGDRAGLVDLARAAVVVDVATGGGRVMAVAGQRLGDGRVRLQVVGVWESTAAARAVLRDVAPPVVWGWFPTGPGSTMSAAMRGLGAVDIRGTRVAEACMTLADLVKHRRVLQPEHPVLDASVSQAVPSSGGKTWEFARHEGTQVDGAYAAAGAVLLALDAPEPVTPAPRKVVLPTA